MACFQGQNRERSCRCLHGPSRCLSSLSPPPSRNCFLTLLLSLRQPAFLPCLPFPHLCPSHASLLWPLGFGAIPLCYFLFLLLCTFHGLLFPLIHHNGCRNSVFPFLYLVFAAELIQALGSMRRWSIVLPKCLKREKANFYINLGTQLCVYVCVCLSGWSWGWGEEGRKRERGRDRETQTMLAKATKRGKLLNKVIHYSLFALQTNGNCWFS